jgi:hypothetical protein
MAMIKRSKAIFIPLAIMGLTACDGAFDPRKRALENTAKEQTAALLRDPMSAQFRNLSVDVEHNVVCGEVNGKNAFAAYIGFELFVFDGQSANLQSDDGFHKKIALCTLRDEASSKRLSNFANQLSRNAE